MKTLKWQLLAAALIVSTSSVAMAAGNGNGNGGGNNGGGNNGGGNNGGGSTVAVVQAGCAGFATSDSCLFTGNINASDSGNASYLLAQNAYNALFNPDIALNAILSTGNANLGAYGTYNPNSTTSGSYTVAGFNVDYFAVKAGNGFVLYKGNGTSTGSWTTELLSVGNGNAPGLSHLVFFGSPSIGVVPEPSTWAMLLLGFGAMGAAMRRRKTTVAFA